MPRLLLSFYSVARPTFSSSFFFRKERTENNRYKKPKKTLRHQPRCTIVQSGLNFVYIYEPKRPFPNPRQCFAVIGTRSYDLRKLSTNFSRMIYRVYVTYRKEKNIIKTNVIYIRSYSPYVRLLAIRLVIMHTTNRIALYDTVMNKKRPSRERSNVRFRRDYYFPLLYNSYRTYFVISFDNTYGFL